MLISGYTLVAAYYWIDQLNPWAARFGDEFGIRWDGLAYLAGVLLAGSILLRWARKGWLLIKEGKVFTFILCAAMGVTIGGRLGYCLLHNTHDIIHRPLEIFALWHGSLASHGGGAGLIIALWVFARQREMSVLPLLDATAANGPMGIALGRIANFINGRLWGKPTSMPWGVIFPQAPTVNGLQVPRYPSQLYAAGVEGLFVFLVARWVCARRHIRALLPPPFLSRIESADSLTSSGGSRILVSQFTGAR